LARFKKENEGKGKRSSKDRKKEITKQIGKEQINHGNRHAKEREQHSARMALPQHDHMNHTVWNIMNFILRPKCSVLVIVPFNIFSKVHSCIYYNKVIVVGFPLLAPVRKVANFEIDSKQWFQ